MVVNSLKCLSPSSTPSSDVKYPPNVANQRGLSQVWNTLMSFDMHCPHGRLTTDDNLSFNSFLPGRLTWRLTNCTSQSKTRKLSESSPWSSTCSLSGILLTYRSHISVAFLVCHQPLHPSSLGAILLSLYYVFLWKNPHTQAALQKAKVIASKN